jgi:predicted nucleotidyltransferase
MDVHEPLADELLEAVGWEIRGALGDRLVGLYLYGSHVSGGFDPGVSDLDLVAVTSVDADRLDLPALDQAHVRLVSRFPAWRDRIEIVYVGAEALSSFRSSRGRLAVISPGEPFHVRDEPVTDWIQNWYLVRETGVVLHGAPAADLVPTIAWREFVAAAVRYAGELSQHGLGDATGGSVAYSILTMCRALATVETDRHPTKQEAAAFARAELPAWAGLIDAALRCRLSRGAVGFDDAPSRRAAVEFFGVVQARIRASLAGHVLDT